MSGERQDRIDQAASHQGSQLVWWRRVVGFAADFHNRTIFFRRGRFIFVTYGLLNGTAFVLGSGVAAAAVAKQGYDPVMLLAFSAFVLLPVVLLGARLFSVLLEWRELFHHPLATLIKPGYMLHGGLFGGAVAIAGFGLRSQIPVLALTDAFALALPLGEAIARLGCHVYGCCYGKPTGSKFGIAYTSAHAKVVRTAPHLHGVKIYPAQLFGFAGHMVLFALLVGLLPNISHHGMLTGVYLVTHPILRLILERFRHDDRGVLTRSITHTNLYSAVQLVGGILLLGWAGEIGTVVQTVSAVSAGSWLTLSAVVLLILHFAIAALAFGIHIDSVGSWVPRRAGALRLVHSPFPLVRPVASEHFATIRSK
jgi:phosphatidylglycerol:prolipoprotein diacylglycerol transferase